MRYTAVCVNLESPTMNNACVQSKISSTQHRNLNIEHAQASFVDHKKIDANRCIGDGHCLEAFKVF